MRKFVGTALAVVCAFAQSGAKRPLTHQDYDSWRSIQTPTLSRDGRYIAYALFPQDGNGELVVYDAKTKAERREPIGALPPPPEPDPNAEPDQEAQPSGIRIAFTSDARFVVFSTLPLKSTPEKAGRKIGLAILDLHGKATAVRIPAIKSFALPERGASRLVYLAAAEETKPATSGSRPEFGTDLILRDLVSGSERTIAEVSEYVVSRDGTIVVYAVSAREGVANGVYATALDAVASETESLLEAKGKHSKLTWDLKQSRVAFWSDRKLYLWNRGSRLADAVVSAGMPGMPSGFAVNERASLQFSRDGSRIFLGTSLPVPSESAVSRASSPDAVVADLWHWKDIYIQPMQRVRAARERSRSYRAVYHISSKKFVQLATAEMAGLSPSDDGRHAIGGDDRAYRSMIEYDRSYSDYYLVDTVTGQRKRLLEKGPSGPGGAPSMIWSPDGEKVLFFRDRHWHVLHTGNAAIENLTAEMPVRFYDELMDRPEAPGSLGSAGWTRDGDSVLLNDQFDIWQVWPGVRKAPVNITEGVGRKTRTQFRVVRLDSDEEEPVRGIKPSEPLLLRAENLDTRDSGFFRDSIGAVAEPRKLVMGPRNYRTVAKAKDADVVLITASTFSEFPDLQITDSSFHSASKITNANPQQTGILWGTGELLPFTNTDGVRLQASLYKPENFDPNKKYPMIVYIYERLSQNIHSFADPKPHSTFSPMYYVSNGYIVLTPDIVYNTGWPGPSALKCVLPAVQAAIDRGFVDENSIGIAGHSWGGYQIAYMVTRTNRFRAAEAGAPVANMTSAYNGIRWGTGLPRQFQYERSQSRIGGSLWQYPLQFIENSPVFHVENVRTPLLLIHNDADDAVPWYQGIELYLSLRRHGKEAYLFNYNGEKHGLRKRVNQKDYTMRMQQFFDHFLKGAPKPQWMEKGIPYLERQEAFNPVSDQ